MPSNPGAKKKFVKLFLKTKFERMHVTHKGQVADHNKLWKKARELEESEWQAFIDKNLSVNQTKIDTIIEEN